MSEQTIAAPPTHTAARPDSSAPRRRLPLAGRLAQHPWAISGIALVILSGALVLWARTRPGYDPYGWLNWGYQTLHLSLDLGGAPSWKPLPYLFTIPYSLFGHYSLWLWMLTSVSIALSGSIFAARIAYRLTGPEINRRAAIAAAVFAGLAVLGIQKYFHLILSVQSDPMIVSLCLAAIDCHLSGHPRWAFAFGVLASLGRPETWPFLGLYSIWAWRRIPSMRWMLGFGLALIPLLWFGIPWLTNGNPVLAGDLALRSPRELHQSKIIGTLNRFTALTFLPIQLAALGATIWAYFRRDWRVLALAGACAIWVLIEIAFVLHGWPGVPRYMFEPAGVMSVLGAVAVGWILREAPRIRRGVPRLSGVVVVGLLVVSLVPAAVARLHDERRDLYHERGRTKVINWLSAAVKHLGGAAHIKYCGEPVTNVEYVSILAFYTHLNDGNVGHRPRFELHLKHPIVLFTQLSNGWAAKPWHTAPAKRSSCAGLKSIWIYTRHHPGGVLVRR